jgi:hypothetical protein
MLAVLRQAALFNHVSPEVELRKGQLMSRERVRMGVA